MPHWFNNSSSSFPLYLAPMAGITDVVFRQMCKQLGADVMVTEFVSAEGILQADERTRKYTEFDDGQRPVGVQLFGADGNRMGEAARKIIDWKQPDFIDINFGCPVNKVVSKNGGSSLLKDCPLLTSVAEGIVKAVPIPVTAKIRIGWDESSINAVTVCKLLEDTGIAAIAIHGRTRAQGYTGLANWEVIAECAAAVKIPVVGNGDIASGQDVEKRRNETGVSGVMIGRAAMHNPWVFREAKHYLATGTHLAPVTDEERFEFLLQHCRLALKSSRYQGTELQTLRSMRTRLMAYTSGLPGGKHLRVRFCKVESLAELEDIVADYLANRWTGNDHDTLTESAPALALS
ncbi:tRNA dihydrouridine synthase DusB [Phragmitibacter flavus]|uniref:tRNA-dihydrouridine synthase n=1 Tax=Phragmitibacter flavus TaxID=2576071 RepID=A0A5R8K9A2_9BACT|nr:tRNA dihydrouridine synthase DusB [Phragmitibacter flavus]TLD68912.1 tRNA dihydrouridine synthase DusB [Phragmitibacter flavus]